jgi:hypothetical protein
MNDDTDLWRGMVCLSLAIGFEEDRARLAGPLTFPVTTVW